MRKLSSPLFGNIFSNDAKTINQNRKDITCGHPYLMSKEFYTLSRNSIYGNGEDLDLDIPSEIQVVSK